MSSVVGRSASQSRVVAAACGFTVSSSGFDVSDARFAFEVWECAPVSVTINTTTSGALWSAPPPFAVLRIAAPTNSHAAALRMIRKVSWSGHSLATYVQESGMLHSGHS